MPCRHHTGIYLTLHYVFRASTGRGSLRYGDPMAEVSIADTAVLRMCYYTKGMHCFEEEWVNQGGNWAAQLASHRPYIFYFERLISNGL